MQVTFSSENSLFIQSSITVDLGYKTTELDLQSVRMAYVGDVRIFQ